MPYAFYFYHDVLEPSRVAQLDAGIRHRQLVVMHGDIEIGMQTVHADDGTYFGGAAEMVAGSEGAWVWRCEIVEQGAPETVLAGEGIVSRAMMKKPIDW